MKKILILLAAVVFLTIACVEPFELKLDIEKKILIVDGFLSDQPYEYTITLKESTPATSTITALKNANVSIWVNDKEQAVLVDKANTGVYFFPEGFAAEANKTYQLKIKLADGRSYQSTKETITPAPAIDKIYHEFKVEGVPFGLGQAPAHYIYIDTKDPGGVNNNYFWNWRLWEKQYYCAMCENGRIFYNSRNRIWECRDEANYLGAMFDYGCDKDCWEIKYNDQLNVLSDQFVDGKEIKGRLVAKIPMYQPNGALVEIRQQTVSPSAYRYLKLLVEQGQNTGSLADTPPAALIGNMKNINDDTENVGGTFLVSSTRTQLYWLDRLDVTKGRHIGLLGGRDPILEPTTSDLTRPPLVPCIASNTRTPKKPIGWKD